MKTIKLSLLTLLFSLISVTVLDAAYDCGCSTLLASGGWLSTGYNSVNGDCCHQDGEAEIEVYDPDGEFVTTYGTYSDVSYKCYNC